MRDAIVNIIVIIGIVFLGFMAINKVISDNINNNKQYEQRLEYCFKQEPRTKDCEFVLWKHEHK